MRVDGSAQAKSHRLEGGEELEVQLPAQEPQVALQAENVEFRIAYEDDHLLVVDKPAGVVVHPAAGHGSGTLVHGLLGKAGGGEEGRPGIVHRLDRDTSGLLVVARSEEAHRRLQDLVRDRALERRYVALVRGRPRSWRGKIEAPIGRDRDDPTRQSLDTERPRVEKRVHLSFPPAAALRGPLAEQLFSVLLTREKKKAGEVYARWTGGDPARSQLGGYAAVLGRQFLHAGELGFDHPFTGERVEVESPLPPELDSYLGRLRANG